MHTHQPNGNSTSELVQRMVEHANLQSRKNRL
jgi:hypothetical protein